MATVALAGSVMTALLLAWAPVISFGEWSSLLVDVSLIGVMRPGVVVAVPGGETGGRDKWFGTEGAA